MALHEKHIELFVKSKFSRQRTNVPSVGASIQAYPQSTLSDRVALGAERVEGSFQTSGWYLRMISDMSLAHNFFDLGLVAGSNHFYLNYVTAVITLV